MFIEFAPSDGAPPVSFTFEGRSITAPAGTSVSAALLMAGETATRDTPVTGAPRSSYCLMGACFECLLTIDGAANQQGCMTMAQDGMTVTRQRGAAVIGPGDTP